MLPEFIPSFIVGPLCGLAANAILSILCLVFSIIYSHYRPLRILFFFYLFITFVFLGWVIWGLQKSPESILWGYRILYAALALLPASWFWFFSRLFNERPSLITWLITGISLSLAIFALLGKGPMFFGFPLEPSPITDIWRPQSRLLKVLIQAYCLAACVLYASIYIARLRHSKEQKQVLIPIILGLLIWFLGGLNDSLIAVGVTIFFLKVRILWFASIWLSIFLTIGIALHFRSLERKVSQLLKDRMDILEQSRKDLERLNRAKSKALDHLSHELMTPLSVIQGNIRLLKLKAQILPSPLTREKVFGSLEKNLSRISDIQKETDQIIRSYEGLEINDPLEKLDTRGTVSTEPILLYPFTERILNKVRQESAHRELSIELDGTKDLNLNMDAGVLEDILISLLRNSIENTPDEGLIRVVLEQKGQWIQLKVQDFGVGITKENQRHLFSGLFHTRDTELYTSKKPYDFGAGGKGLNLLKLKVYGQRLGFDISVGSERCLHLPKESDLCHGKISSCGFCKKPEDFLSSGGSTFCVTFPLPK